MIDQRARRRFASTAMLLLALMTGGCGGVSFSPPPRDEEILQAFGDGALASTAPPDGAAPRLNLYLDSSGSMKGYVADTGSTYRRALDFLLDRAATTGYDLSLFSFSDQVTPLGNVASSGIFAQGFYSGSTTSFPRLFQHIGQTQDGRTVSIIVSDLVQSGKTKDQRDLVLAFKELARHHPEVLVLGFRSSFRGSYFVEGQRAGSVLKLWLDGKEDRSRPFYIVLVAPSRARLEQARKLLLPDIGGHEEFDASSPGLPVSEVGFLPWGRGEAPVWNVFRPPEALKSQGAPRSLLSFVEVTPPSADRSPLRLRLHVVADGVANPMSLLRSARSFGFTIERRSYKGGKWGDRQMPDLSPEALFSQDGKLPALDVSYAFPRPALLSWDVYRVRMAPGEGNLRVPLWVEEWATLDDSLEIWGNRTLKLDLFVEALTRSIREQVPFSEHYVLLGRGDR